MFLKKIMAPLLFASCLMANENQDLIKEKITSMLTAIEKNDSTAFAENGSPEFKRAISPEMIDQIHSSLNLTQFDLEYFGTITRDGISQSLWKLSTADDKEWLIRYSTDDDVVLGFFIN